MITKDIESLVTNPYIVPALRFKEVLIRYFGHFYAVNGGTYPLSPRKNTGKHRSTSKNAFVLVSAKISVLVPRRCVHCDAMLRQLLFRSSNHCWCRTWMQPQVMCVALLLIPFFFCCCCCFTSNIIIPISATTWASWLYVLGFLTEPVLEHKAQAGAQTDDCFLSCTWAWHS